MFAIKATLRRTRVRLQWDAGRFIGTASALTYIDAELGAGRVVGLPGLHWQGHTVKSSDVASWLLVNELFDNVELVSGEIPEAPAVPEGAVS